MTGPVVRLVRQLSLWSSAPPEPAAKLLRRERQAKKVTQTQLAAVLGADQATVSRLERGRGTLSFEDIVRAAGLLAIDLDRLLGDSDIRCGRRTFGDPARSSARLAAMLPRRLYRDFVRAGGSLAALRSAREGRAPLSVGQAARIVALVGSTALVDPNAIRR